MIIKSVSDISATPLFLKIVDILEDCELYLKLEGLNIAHSVKLKTAKSLIGSISHQLIPGRTKIIESSSGNLAIALSIICREEGIEFICVTDPNISEYSEKLIKIYGGKIIKVLERDENGGFLNTRIRTIKKLLESSDDYIWTNQYANPANPEVHYRETAKEIYNEFKRVDYLFVGAGTTGTLMGCLKFFKEFSPKTKIIAIDAEGSVTFGFESKKRYIPGLGTSRKPEITNEAGLDDIIIVSEADTIKMCRRMLEKGLFVGGSTGTVLAGIENYRDKIPQNSIVVTISPDFGDKYSTTIFNNKWVREKFSLNYGEDND